MLFVTGDMHGDQTFHRLEYLERQIQRQVQYYGCKPGEPVELIVAGDFGYCWHNRMHLLDELSKRLTALNTTLYFVDGNHEDFHTLYQYPIDPETQMRPLCDNIFHLQRGHIYTIHGKNVFTFGGALSVDKAWRTPGVSWWPEELPTTAEWIRGETTLENHMGTLDLVVTHEAPLRILRAMYEMGDLNYFREDSEVPIKLNHFMDIIENKFPGLHWFFGHHHAESNIYRVPDWKTLSCKYTCICNYATRIL